MDGSKRVYPREKQPGKWFSYLLLFLSAVVVMSGLVWRGGGEELSIEPVVTPSPIPTDAYFDETPEQRELTLPASCWYALQLGAFESETAAGELARQFTQRGAAGYVWQDGRYRTLAALYPTQDEAQNVRRRLSEQHTVDSYLYRIALPALHVRMSGMKGQLDILEAAFTHGNDLVSRLQAISVMMDRGEKNAQEAVECLTALEGQMQTVNLRLQQRFIRPRHQTVEGMIACFEDYLAFCQKLDPNESAAALSVKLKWQTFASLEKLKHVYDALGNT